MTSKENALKKFLPKAMSFFYFFIFVFIFIYLFIRDDSAPLNFEISPYKTHYLISSIGILFWLSILFFKAHIQEKVVLFWTSLVIAFYIGELFLVMTGNGFEDPRIRLAARDGIIFDSRTKYQVIRDFREIGVATVPNISPGAKFKSKVFEPLEADIFFPLGGISNTNTVYCNEGGEYLVYKSDRFGFNNNDLVWQNGTADWILIGDSFTLGACVKPSFNIAGQLERLTGSKVINLGNSGNGPLLEYATLLEYGGDDFQNVIWLYYEGNDLVDNLRNEIDSEPRLLRYLSDKNFTQSLTFHQTQIDTVLSNMVEFEYERKQKELDLIEREQQRSKSNFLRLTTLRWFIARALRSFFTGDQESFLPTPRDYEIKIDSIFIDILNRAKKVIEDKGGRLVFVYLPEYARYVYADNHDLFRSKKQLIDTIKSLDIAMVDIHEEFVKSGDPLKFFPFRGPGHYNSDGYEVVAKKISEFAGK